MIYSMMGYVSVMCEFVMVIGNGGISVLVELCIVNLCFFDFNFWMLDDVCVCEFVLCEMLMNKLLCGKVDVCINL